jgi:hypothetical protein
MPLAIVGRGAKFVRRQIICGARRPKREVGRVAVGDTSDNKE